MEKTKYAVKECDFSSLSSWFLIKSDSYKLVIFINLTKATAVVILVPPEAPITNLALPAASEIMLGVMEERGLLPGAMKLAGEGARPK